jgi:hypothetical protein
MRSYGSPLRKRGSITADPASWVPACAGTRENRAATPSGSPAAGEEELDLREVLLA